MESCEVLIVGGGPAGSTCAWQLRRFGCDVVVMDKCAFPRDKICAGWITPQVIQSLELDLADYALGRVFQPLTAFRTSLLGHPAATTSFDRAVSYGIRRCEFDEYLLRRSGARLYLGEAVRRIDRTGDGWIVNGALRARMLVGAGGHFCPVARRVRGDNVDRRPLVTAVEAEFPLCEAACDVETGATEPRLYFCDDLAGYGWCVRKGEFLNIGIGRINARDVPAQLSRLLEVLRRDGSFSGELPKAVHGHAYYLYDGGRAPMAEDGSVLIGDAAGLADPHSGEGIRQAIESGLLAAETIHAAQGRYDRHQLQSYSERIMARFGRRPSCRRATKSRWLPRPWQTCLMGRLIGNRWFARRVILERWFLHAHQSAILPPAAAYPADSAQGNRQLPQLVRSL